MPLFAAPIGFSDNSPSQEGSLPSAGSMLMASKGDHSHQRISVAVAGTFDSTGNAAVSFVRPFPAGTPPVTMFVYEEAANSQPIIIKRKSWITDASGNYTGVNVQGYRMNTLPASLTLLTALVNFNVAGSIPVGVTFDCFSIKQG